VLREILRIVVQRLLVAVPLLVFVSILVFIVLRVIPADPAAMSLPPNATREDIDEMRRAMLLDRPIWEQYVRWAANFLQGDFGRSIAYKIPVSGLIAQTLPATIELAVASLILACLLGIGGGLLMFHLRGGKGETALDIASTGMMSIPQFLWAIFLILAFGVALNWLPFTNRLDAAFRMPNVTGFLILDSLLIGRMDILGSALLHMVLPVTALALGFAPLIMRIMQTSLLDVYREDYIRMARMRGVGERRILLHHALKNAFLPTLSLIGVQFGFLFGGTLLVEVIFSFHGIGALMVEAVRNVDLPIIQTVALIYALAVLVINMTVDIGYVLLNPKLRRA
jgi:peptide/nickel transport system permease protein